MQSSGVTAKATGASDTAVTLITLASGTKPTNLSIFWDTASGFYTVDGGTTWIFRMDDSRNLVVHNILITGDVQMKRIASGTGLTDGYAAIW